MRKRSERGQTQGVDQILIIVKARLATAQIHSAGQTRKHPSLSRASRNLGLKRRGAGIRGKKRESHLARSHEASWKTREPRWLAAVLWSLSSPETLGRELWAGEAPRHPSLCSRSSSAQGLVLGNAVPRFSLLDTLVPPSRQGLGDGKSAEEAEGHAGPFGSKPSLLPGPVLSPPAQGSLSTSHGRWAAYRCARWKGGSLPSPMWTPSPPYSPSSPSTRPCPGPQPTPHPPGEDLVIF